MSNAVLPDRHVSEVPHAIDVTKATKPVQAEKRHTTLRATKKKKTLTVPVYGIMPLHTLVAIPSMHAGRQREIMPPAAAGSQGANERVG